MGSCYFTTHGSVQFVRAAAGLIEDLFSKTMSDPPKFAAPPKALMMFYRLLREIDVPEMMGDYVVTRICRNGPGTLKANRSKGKRPPKKPET